ncbi:putative ribonuclease H-like domain-containing protein [Tanacetum coccineum]|uniref:Ribonuclease H-like domain-containing protein n=1 Tax=Tanacetum coccineum TaxID=301880 RepID=A0ABQ5FD55_9ASTR
MDLETAQTNATTKLPILKQGEYEMWRLRIEQYFQVQDYALWDVIENGNSFKPTARTTANADGTSTSMIPGPVTTEEKAQKKNDVKARSMLLMALPNEHQLTFNQYKDAKTLFDAIQTRFGGNDATRKTQKTLLKQMYENFNAPSTESLDSIFNRLQKIVSQLDILGETGKKITINGSDTAGYDKSKVECFNYHKIGHFARECRETSSKAMVAIDGAGFDWSFMADEEVPTNMALMAFSDSEFNKSEFNLATYKRGLASVEEQLVFYKKNEVMFCDQIDVLKRDTSFKDLEINALKRSQISDNSRKGVGFVSYNAVPPPPTGLFSPPTIDLSNSGLEEFHKPGSLLLPFKDGMGHLQKEDQGYVDSGFSRHMTRNMSYLSDFKEFDRGYVTFGGGARGGRITSKGTLKIGKLDFCGIVLFTDTACFVMSPDFKLPDESQVLLNVPRKNNMYSVDMKNIFPKESLTCLVAKATLDESMLWHSRLGHINFNTINKLVKNNLVRGLPAKRFENDQTYVACLKRKQHKASCRTPALSFMRPFGCHVTILNTLDHLGKFDGKSDDGFFVGYSLTSTNSNDFAGSEESNGAGHTSKETEFSQDYIVMPLWKDGSMFDSSSKNSSDDEPQPSSNAEKKDDEGVSKASGFSDQEKPESSTLNINIVGLIITTRLNRSQNVSDIFSLERSATLEATHADLFGDKTEMDMSNLTTSYQVPTTPNTRIHKDHSLDHVIGDIQSGVQTRGMIKNINEHSDPAWVEAMQGKGGAFTVYNYKRFGYSEFSKARIEAIRLFLAYASFMGFMVYQIDVKSTFLYGTIKEEVYVCQPLGFKDPDYPDKVYKVVKALYGLHQAPRA